MNLTFVWLSLQRVSAARQKLTTGREAGGLKYQDIPQEILVNLKSLILICGFYLDPLRLRSLGPFLYTRRNGSIELNLQQLYKYGTQPFALSLCKRSDFLVFRMLYLTVYRIPNIVPSLHRRLQSRQQNKGLFLYIFISDLCSYIELLPNTVNASSVLQIYFSATPYRQVPLPKPSVRGNLNATSLYSGYAFLLCLDPDPDPRSKCRSGSKWTKVNAEIRFGAFAGTKTPIRA